MQDISSYGTGRVFAWSHDYLIKLLTTSNPPIITDPILLNAFRAIDREEFVPPPHKEIAHQDKIVNIGYNEVLTNPVLVAKQLQALAPKYGGKYLHLGTGMGYDAAILAFVAGDEGKVYTMERIQWLWERARENIHKYKQLKNVDILLRDGKDGLADKGPYDGIMYSFVVDKIPEVVKHQLKVGGKLTRPTPDHYLEVIERTGEEDFMVEMLPGFSALAYGEVKEGTA